MTYADKYLKPFALFEDQTFEEYCSKVPEFYFKKEVPEDVIKNFEIVEKLLSFSYFEYKFIDEAYSKAIRTFEMAMSIRYRELVPGHTKKLGFNSLISRLTALNVFDTNLETLKWLSQIRNHFSHPERHSFGGVAYWDRIESIPRLVNEMYEDIELRIERQKMTVDFIENKKLLSLEKYIIMHGEDCEPIILFNLSLLWTNNKQLPSTYLLEYSPLFDLTFETEYQVKGPEIFDLKISNPVFNKTGLTATNIVSGEELSFSSILDNPAQIDSFKEWETRYDAIYWNWMYEHSIQACSSEILVPELRQFQKM